MSSLPSSNSSVDRAFQVSGWRQLFTLPPSYTFPKLVHKAHRWAGGLVRVISPARLGTRDWGEVLGQHSSALALVADRWRAPHLLAPASTGESKATLKRIDPTLSTRLMDQAQRVAEGRIELLGSGDISIGWPPDWHRDFKSGARWPRRHVSWLRYFRLDDGSDYKVPWELSRFHHGLALAQAYALTADRRWSRAWQLIVDDWLSENPVEFGINWASPMDVAIRAVNWIGALELLGGALDDEAFTKRLVASLFWHGRYVADNLEIHQGLHTTIANNHLLADLTGLAVLGAWFDHTDEGKRWLRTAHDLLPQEAERQVYSDGVTFEASIPYHRLTTELILASAIQLDRAGFTVPELLRSRLRNMLSFILAYTREDGTSPVLGDADDGRLWWWVLPRVDRAATTTCGRYAEFLDHRHLIALGALWLDDPDLQHQCGPIPPEVYWMFGAQGAVRLASLTGQASPAHSQGFPEGGVYVLRSPGRHLLVDAGPHGQQGLGGHAHNDALHIEFWADGIAWLVDSGVGVYAPDLALRNRLRGTGAHNTLMIDDQEQWPFDPGRPFLLPAGSAPHVTLWRTGMIVDWLDVVSHAYARLPEPVNHRRRVLIQKQIGGWAVSDELTGHGDHSVRWRLHFGPGISISEVSPNAFIAQHRLGALLSVRCTDFPEGEFLAFEDIASFSYGTIEPTVTLEWHGAIAAPASLNTTIVPVPAGQENELDLVWQLHSTLAEMMRREANLQL